MQLYQTDEQKKAAKLTGVICLALILLFIVWRWQYAVPPTPLVSDLIEINLGNDEEGLGEEQPLMKGKPSNAKDENNIPSETSAADQSPSEENDDNDAATLIKAKDKKNKESSDKEDKKSTDKKPKITYKGPENGKNGNNADEDNGYKYQGNKNNGGDNGTANGDKDSYGTHNGGSKGGPKVIRGNRKIEGSYKFVGELNKATIYAIIEVSPSGEGTFKGFGKGTTNRNQAYENAVKNYLKKIKFNTSEEKSKVTVQFNFDID